MPLCDTAGRPQVYSNGNQKSYGRGFGHIAFNTPDVFGASEMLLAKQIPFQKKPNEGRMKGLAFVLDPDGWWIELVQGMLAPQDLPGPAPGFCLSQTMLRIADPNKTLPFYRDLFDMQLLKEYDFGPQQGDFSLYFLGSKSDDLQKLLSSSEPETLTKRMFDPCLELTWNHGTETLSASAEEYSTGNSDPKGFGHLGFLVDDLDKFCDLLSEVPDLQWVKKPQDGAMRGLAFVKDPTGYWVEIIQRSVKF